MENELFLTLLSSFSEDESYSIAQNSKWSIRRRFENETYKLCYPPYGYVWNGKNLVINPKQMPIVKEIFATALEGKSAEAIAKELNERKVPTQRENMYSSKRKTNVLSAKKRKRKTK